MEACAEGQLTSPLQLGATLGLQLVRKGGLQAPQEGAGVVRHALRVPARAVPHTHAYSRLQATGGLGQAATSSHARAPVCAAARESCMAPARALPPCRAAGSLSSSWPDWLADHLIAALPLPRTSFTCSPAF